MNDERYEIEYDLTAKEAFEGMNLAGKTVYSGAWRFAVVALGVIQGIGLGIICIFLASLGTRFVMGENTWQPLAAIVCMFGVILAVMKLTRAIRMRLADKYVASLDGSTETIAITIDGIEMSNGRSRSFRAWQDIEELVSSKSITVATFAAQGIILPDRVLTKSGEPESLRAQMDAWHKAAVDWG